MNWQKNVKKLIMVLGDVSIFYISFYLAIFFRLGFYFDPKIFSLGLIPFSCLFVFWLLSFSFNHLYETEYFRPFSRFIKLIFWATVINAILATFLFYLMPEAWRTLFNLVLGRISVVKVTLIGQEPETSELKNYLIKNKFLGYQIVSESDDFSIDEKQGKADIYVISDTFKNKNWDEILLKASESKAVLILLKDFYQDIFYKVPLRLINDHWFLDNLKSEQKKSYEWGKRIFDICGSIFLIILTSPLWLLISILIKVDSSGPIIYRSLRLGRNMRLFKIYKFRTMVKNADQLGPAWTLNKDERVTKIGKILRKLHLDELPQSLNILLGDISFVGPRPVEEKLARDFNIKIPYYKLRHLIKPGVVGWAQINHRYSASLEDDVFKLEYDLYYLKHRNFWFDLVIMFKAWRIPFEIQSH
ncbi:MAG: sugar transferase [Candidatus Parcubacteria bacterium]|nr:sugar transferase [Candidatus Parcubacteria bacterium]